MMLEYGAPVMRGLIDGLRQARSFLSIARATLLYALDAFAVPTGVIEVHASTGRPVLCVATLDLDPSELRAYLDHGYRCDQQLERLRGTHAPSSSEQEAGRVTLLAPLLGDGVVIGALRLVGTRTVRADDIAQLAAICTHVSVRLAQVGFAAPIDRHPLVGLTRRQRQVARLVAMGRSNIEISHDLAVSPNAVKKHLGLALAVIGVANRTELAAVANRAAAAIELLDSEHLELPGFQIVRNSSV